MSSRLRSVPAALCAALLVAGRLVAQPATPPDLQALIANLEAPKTGAFTFNVRFGDALLEDVATAEEARLEIATIEPRTANGTAGAADWARLAWLYRTVGDTARADQVQQQAEAGYRALLAARPDDAEALVGLGRLLAGETAGAAEAEELLRRALAADPDLWAAYAPLATALYAQASAFVRALERAVSALPADQREGLGTWSVTAPADSPNAYREAAERLAAKVGVEIQPTADDTAEAAAAAERATAFVDDARNRLRERLALEPTAALFEGYVAFETAVLTGRLRSALWSDNQPGLGELGFDEAMRQIVPGGFVTPAIVAAGEAACREDPQNLRRRGLVGSLEAMELLIAFMRPGPDGEPGLVAPTAEQARPAIENLTAAMALPPEKREGVLGTLASLYMIMDDREACRRLGEEAMARGEWDAAAASGYGVALLGLRLQDLMAGNAEPPAEKLPPVEAGLTKWLEATQPQEAAAYGTLAALRGRLGDTEGQIAALLRAREIEPQSPLYACALGVLYVKGGRYEEAADVLQAATEMTSNDPTVTAMVHAAYGVALLGLGREDEATTELNWKP